MSSTNIFWMWEKSLDISEATWLALRGLASTKNCVMAQAFCHKEATWGVLTHHGSSSKQWFHPLSSGMKHQPWDWALNCIFILSRFWGNALGFSELGTFRALENSIETNSSPHCTVPPEMTIWPCASACGPLSGHWWTVASRRRFLDCWSIHGEIPRLFGATSQRQANYYYLTGLTSIPTESWRKHSREDVKMWSVSIHGGVFICQLRIYPTPPLIPQRPTTPSTLTIQRWPRGALNHDLGVMGGDGWRWFMNRIWWCCSWFSWCSDDVLMMLNVDVLFSSFCYFLFAVAQCFCFLETLDRQGASSHQKTVTWLDQQLFSGFPAALQLSLPPLWPSPLRGFTPFSWTFVMVSDWPLVSLKDP